MIRKGCSLACLLSMALLFSSWFWKQDASGASDQFCAKATRFIEKKYNVRTYGTGGSVVGGVSKINLRFESNLPADITLARQYLVGVVEDVYHLANTDKKLRPFLKDQHISREALDIIILFYPCFYTPISSEKNPSVVSVTNMKKYASYDSYNCKADKFNEVHRELYEEARKIVLGEEAADQGSSS